MANTKNNVQPQVVTTTTTTTSRRGRRRRRRANRTPQTATTTVRKVTTARQSNRPRRRRRNRFGAAGQQGASIFKQRITATLGTIGSNEGDKIELEMAALLNPALMKESTGQNQYGPLQMYAANYNLWRANNIVLKLTPLVGGSAVSGTAVRASLNLAGTPGSASWSALGARRHKDTNPGKPLVMRIPGNALAGPKEGWFLCSTKNDPQMCIGGSIEVHTLGKTMSAYKAEPFKGPLFLCELTAEWWFKNYNPEPGMMNLVKTDIQESAQEVKIHSKAGEPILISVPQNSALARATGSVGVDAAATPSEIIWSVFDTTMDVITGNLPPPFQWLFSAGWWFVKRIANKKTAADPVRGEPNAGEVTFKVFQSLSDAQNDVPCIATGDAESTNTNITGWHVTQVTPGNVGNPSTAIVTSRTGGITLDNIQIISTPALGRRSLYGHIYKTVPTACVAAQQAVGGESKVYTYTIWDLENPIFLQNGAPINPAELQSQPYPILSKEGRNYATIGMVYAAGHARLPSQGNNIDWTTVLWRATKTTQVKLQSDNDRTDQYIFVQPTQRPAPNDSGLPSTIYTVTTTQKGSLQQTMVPITAGGWYLSTFVAYNGQLEFNNYGVPFYLNRAEITNFSMVYDIGRDVHDVGAAMQTTMPITLAPPTSQSIPSLTSNELAQLRQLLAPKSEYSPLEYDNLEMPPLEGEEEEEQGAIGGYTPLEGARQQRVRGPSAVIKYGDEDTALLLEETEEEDDEDYESELDDDDYAELPSLLKNLLTPEAKSLCDDLKRKGLDHDIAVKAAQVAFPHPAKPLWEATYHNALVDGLSPPSARDLAWGAISEYI
ncbi:MAG: ORF2 [Zhejiang mamastrovirus 3]|nr:MAG: ORF2 [Zhejiang mamastrovirus 3]